MVVFYREKADKEALEVLLEEVVLKGCEILFVDNEDAAHDLLKKEHPYLLLLAASCSSLRKQGVPFVALKKPYQKEEIVEECSTLLGLTDEEISKELPM